MNISFFITQQQFKARQKFVTRRLGWKKAKPGDVLMGVVKGQGIPKGGKIEKLGAIRLLNVRRERLDRMITDCEYGQRECTLEGFPLMTPKEFVDMFCEHNGCTPETEITRLEFEYL